MGREERFRIVDDQVRGELAVAQDWTCGTCGAELVAGAATVVFASPAEGSPAFRAPVLVHESCADEQRASFPDWADARETLGRAGDPAAAERALKAVVALRRDAVNAVVDQAVGPLDTKIKGLETENAKLGQSVAKLREKENELLSQNRRWSDAFTQQKAFGQELKRRIMGLIEDTKADRFLTRIELLAAITKHLQPEQARE